MHRHRIDARAIVRRRRNERCNRSRHDRRADDSCAARMLAQRTDPAHFQNISSRARSSAVAEQIDGVLGLANDMVRHAFPTACRCVRGVVGNTRKSRWANSNRAVVVAAPFSTGVKPASGKVEQLGCVLESGMLVTPRLTETLASPSATKFLFRPACAVRSRMQRRGSASACRRDSAEASRRPLVDVCAIEYK